MDGVGYLSLLLLWMVGSLLVVTAQGVIICECTTQECRDEGTDTCYADHYCYSQYFKDTLTHGCMNDRSSLLCENHKPKGKGIEYWPSLYCCNDRNFCNKDVTPTLPADEEDDQQSKQNSQPDPQSKPASKQPSDRDHGGRHHQDTHHDPHDPPPVRCQGNGDDDGSGSPAEGRNSSGNKVINPIYIAVPVAGVCVLLALVIFAMYLLRRRHHYDNYHHYHDHLALPPPGHAHKQPGGGIGMGGGAGGGGGGSGGGGGGGGGGVGVPLYHHHHHCDCICKKALPPCGGKVNRCTDSERSSSGSETKLFLQA